MNFFSFFLFILIILYSLSLNYRILFLIYFIYPTYYILKNIYLGVGGWGGKNGSPPVKHLPPVKVR
jgi:hypothetical protein